MKVLDYQDLWHMELHSLKSLGRRFNHWIGNKTCISIVGIINGWSVIKVKLAIGLLGNGQMAGYELDLAFLAMAVYLVINGSKLFSVSKIITKRDSKGLPKAA